MADNYTFQEQGSVLAPANDAFAVTPSDTTEFTQFARALYIGTAGSLVLLTRRGNIATFVNVTTAQVLPVQTRRVNSTGTTASGIVGLY